MKARPPRQKRSLLGHMSASADYQTGRLLQMFHKNPLSVRFHQPAFFSGRQTRLFRLRKQAALCLSDFFSF